MTNINFQTEDRIFEWDSEKAKINKIKHGISFKTATKVFDDENRIERPTTNIHKMRNVGKLLVKSEKFYL